MQNQEIFKKPVWKAIFSMGIPSLISVLVMIIYNMADMYFIGFLNDYTQVAAVILYYASVQYYDSGQYAAWKWWLHPDCAGTRSRREETGTQLYELVYLDSHFIRSDYSRSDYSFFESFVEIPRNQ